MTTIAIAGLFGECCYEMLFGARLICSLTFEVSVEVAAANLPVKELENRKTGYSNNSSSNNIILYGVFYMHILIKIGY